MTYIPEESQHNNPLWKLHGPKWLNNGPTWIPSKALQMNTMSQISEDTESDMGQTPSTIRPEIQISQIIDVSRYSTLNKLLRVASYVPRFIKILKGQTSNVGAPTVDEIRKSQRQWIQHRQASTYEKKIANIRSNAKSKTNPSYGETTLFVY